VIGDTLWFVGRVVLAGPRAAVGTGQAALFRGGTSALIGLSMALSAGIGVPAASASPDGQSPSAFEAAAVPPVGLSSRGTGSPVRRPCGRMRRPPARWRHVVWIVVENRGTANITDPDQAPYLTGLAARCGVATDVRATVHPSLPNYFALTAGSTLGVTRNTSPDSLSLRASSIFTQLGPEGWRVYAQSMPGPCHRQDAGRYTPRHNPAVYFVNLSRSCGNRDLPLPDKPKLSAAFTMIVPDLVDGMHDSDVSTGDRYLAGLIPKLLRTKQYRSGSTAIVVTADEDEGTAANQIATFVIAPSVRPGTVSTRRFTHYSILRTTEQLLGLPALRYARGARSMRGAFNLVR